MADRIFNVSRTGIVPKSVMKGEIGRSAWRVIIERAQRRLSSLEIQGQESSGEDIRKAIAYSRERMIAGDASPYPDGRPNSCFGQFLSEMERAIGSLRSAASKLGSKRLFDQAFDDDLKYASDNKALLDVDAFLSRPLWPK